MELEALYLPLAGLGHLAVKECNMAFLNSELMKRLAQGLVENPFDQYVQDQNEYPDQSLPQIQPISEVAPTGYDVNVPQVQRIAPSAAEQQMADLVRQYPTEEQFAHPGKLKRIVAALAGIDASLRGGNGPQTTTSMLQEPRKQAIADWKSRVEALNPLANLQMDRERIAQAQYGHDVSKMNAILDAASSAASTTARKGYYSQLAQHWSKMDEVSRQNAEKRLTFEQRQELQKALEDQRQQGALKLESKRQTGREQLESTRQSSAMARTKYQQSEANKRAAMRSTNTRTLSPTDEMRKEMFAAVKLTRENPKYRDFYKVPEKAGEMFEVKAPQEISKEDMDLYKLFINKLAASTDTSDYSYEDLDGEEEE